MEKTYKYHLLRKRSTNVIQIVH